VNRREFLKNGVALGAAAAVGTGFLRPGEEGTPCLRPPGALSEDDFLSTCIRCGRCADACPNRCITAFTEETGKLFSMSPETGGEGTPVIFPRQKACNLCMGDQGDELLCTAACPTGALQLVKKDPETIQKKVSMGRAVVDTNLCWSYNGGSCGVCVRACPYERKALKAGFFERPIVDPELCVGCGLCERSCIRYPQAITVVPDVERAS
jgi:MauM/NapG family ferredoxin protein